MIIKLGDSLTKNKASWSLPGSHHRCPQRQPLSLGASPLLFQALNIEAATCHQSRFHTASSCQVRLRQVCGIS